MDREHRLDGTKLSDRRSAFRLGWSEGLNELGRSWSGQHGDHDLNQSYSRGRAARLSFKIARQLMDQKLSETSQKYKRT